MDGEPKKNRNGKGNRGRLIAERLLVLRNYFYKMASEGKGASWKEISAYLKSQSLEYVIDRKTFYRDCESLQNIFGLKLEYDAVNNEWCINNPVFSERELETTINCIRYDSYLPKDEVEAITEKLKVLVYMDKVKTLKRNFQYDRVKKVYERAKENLKIILKAIYFRCCISFRYIVYPSFEEMSKTATKEIDEYGRPKFYKENGDAVHKYRDSGVCSPIYVIKRTDGFFLYMSERDTASGERARKSFNIAEMEDVTILPEESSWEEPVYYPWSNMMPCIETTVTFEARTECLDAVKMFFEDAKIELRDRSFMAEVVIENVLADLVPFILACDGDIQIVSPR